MKRNGFKLVLSVGLAAMLAVASVGPAAATGGNAAAPAAGDAEIASKDEVIYGTLGADGSVRSLYAVNHFVLSAPGAVLDYGDYASVTNLTDTTPVAQNGDAVSLLANREHFYYQGNMNAIDLPWEFEVSYFLDGVSRSPEELGGKSGDLEIRIATRQNPAVDPVFYEQYMLQISVTLDTQKSGDLRAPDAAVANAGKNTVIAYTVMPGKDADISLGAAVREFTMTGIDITALPFSMGVELPDTDGMTGEFTELSDAIFELNEGVAALLKGASELKTGAAKLKNGSTGIKSGLSQLSGQSGQLVQASARIGGALTQIASSLNGKPGEMNPGDLTKLPQGLAQLAAGLEEISGGMTELKNGFAPAHAALDGAISGIPGAIDQQQIAGLYAQVDPSQHGVLDQLTASYAAAQTVKGTYAQVKGAFGAVGATLDTLSASIGEVSAGLRGMSKQIGDALAGMEGMQQLAQLAAGLAELDSNYGAFHSGLAEYMNGVDALAGGYADFHSGVATFEKGVGELRSGVAELHDGTTQLADETAGMPGAVQTEIDELLAQYTGGEFTPVSFTSPKNTHTERVQFVLKCDGIEKPEEPKPDSVTEAQSETFWDRLTALFAG